MISITNKNMVAKTAALVAGFALLASSFAFAQPARAATAAELQAQIQVLLAQISLLQGGQTVSTSFTMNLTIGSTGSQVTALQNWLISKGYSIPAGATGYFGTQTQGALAAYQAANGIVPAVGYFGPITRAKINAQVIVTPNPTPTPPTTGLGGGEASLEDLTARDGQDDEVEEGASASIAEFEFDVEDGDIRIDRVDLTFEAGGANDEDKPWETFDTITILDADGDELASENVSDEDDWLDEDEPYVFRFTGLNYVVREGDQGMLTIEVEAHNSVDGTDDGEVWTVYIDTDGIRGVDGEGLDQYLGDDSETVTFDVVEEGEGEELNLSSSSNDPDASVLQVEDNARSDWYTVLVFELDAEDADIELNEIPVVIDTGTENVADVINDAELVIDGETFDDFDLTNGNTTTSTFTFDIDGDFVIDDGDTVEVEVRLEFKAADGANYAAGETVQASVTGADIEAEGADDLNADGNVTGEEHTLEVSGVNVSRENRSAQTTVVDGADNDYATFTIEVEVTAFEEDIFIPQTAVTAYTYQIENASNGNVIGNATATTSTISSSANTSGAYYRVNEGDSETFTFTVTYNPLAADEGSSYRMQLLTIEFNDSAAPPDQTWNANPASMYETQSTYLND